MKNQKKDETTKAPDSNRDHVRTKSQVTEQQLIDMLALFRMTYRNATTEERHGVAVTALHAMHMIDNAYPTGLWYTPGIKEAELDTIPPTQSTRKLGESLALTRLLMGFIP